MKKYLLLFLLSAFFCTAHVNAQSKYTLHTIAKGETLSMLAQKYHTSVGDIMRLNGMNTKSQLKIGEKIKIPASSSSTQKNAAAKTPSKTKTTQTDTAVSTHYVTQNETLYSISKNFGVTVEQLKEWNNLTDEHIHFGQQLAVSAEGASLLAAKKGNTATNAVNTTSAPVETKNTDAVQSNIKAQSTAENANTSNDGSDSYFAKDFSSAANLKSLTGYGTIFKTTNGWKDKKYYILMNDAPSGTIVKVSSPNGNSIYAKVLWSLDDTTLNYGLNFRISDAAASALAVNEHTFSLKVEYH